MIVKHFSKQITVPDEMSADFAYWGDMPHWTADEVTALTLGVDPVNCGLCQVMLQASLEPALRVSPTYWQSALWLIYVRLRKRLRCAVEIGELGSMPWVGGEGELIHPPISRSAWAEWLELNELELSEEFNTLIRQLRNAGKNNRDDELQEAAEQLAKELQSNAHQRVTKREIANLLASSDEWKELTAGRIERVIRVTW